MASKDTQPTKPPAAPVPPKVPLPQPAAASAVPPKQHPQSSSKTAPTAPATAAPAVSQVPPYVDPKEEIKARARAYALSEETKSNKKKASKRNKTPPNRPLPVPEPPTNKRPVSAAAPVAATIGTPRKIHPTGQPAPVPVQGHPAPAAIVGDDDYQRWVGSLRNLDDDLVSLPSISSFLKWDDDDEDEFRLESDEEEDDDDDDEEVIMEGSVGSQPSSPVLNVRQDWCDPNELELELGGLLEEDLENVFAELLGGPKEAPPTHEPAQYEARPQYSPMKEAARPSTAVVTLAQVKRLKDLLAKHYQLLIQQSVLAVRAVQAVRMEKAQRSYEDIWHESPEELVEIIDSGVGMLQDLDQNRRDAIRNFMQLDGAGNKGEFGGPRSLQPQLAATSTRHEGQRRLTRSAFHQSLEDPTLQRDRHTMFDIQGLGRLKNTFEIIDQSYSKMRRPGAIDILAAPDHASACMVVMQQAGAKIEEPMLPGVSDISLTLTDPKEVFGNEVSDFATDDQKLRLRKNRNQFTAAEDNLVLRGVNLYGEKQWLLIADRYLPDRSINQTSQRYSKICLLLYRAHGIEIDSSGNLKEPPLDIRKEDLDEAALAKFKRADPPAVMGVHRWSIEEDLTLLRAVPFTGNMWAELSQRLIPHRDRGALRKRYQVLERRIQATAKREKRDNESTTAAANRSPAKVPIASKPTEPKKRAKNAARPAPRMPVPALPPMHYHPVQPAPGRGRGGRGAHHNSPGRGHPAYYQHNPVHGRYPMPPYPMPPYGRPPLPITGPSPSLMAYGKAPANGPARVVVPGRGPGAVHHLAPPHPVSTAVSRFDSTVGNSRTGFERILNETTNDWSQMSQINQLMHDESDSNATSRIGNHARATEQAEQLPSLEMDSASKSGFSMLKDSAKPSSSTSSPAKTTGSIMANVLQRAGGKKPVPPQHRYSSPGKSGNGQVSGYGVYQSSPSHPHTNGAPTYGTPTQDGFSNAARNIYSPGVQHGYSSGPGMHHFSPAGGSSIMGPVGSTRDGFSFSNFPTSHSGQQALECSEELGRFRSAPLSAIDDTDTPLRAELLGEAHALVGLKDSDLEVISALNTLSNSPAKFLSPQKRPSEELSQEEVKPGPGESKMSLFAAVVGAVDKKQETSDAAPAAKKQKKS